MIQRKENVFILLTTLFLTFCLMSIANSDSDVNKGDESKERIVTAKVNGEPIYKDELAPYAEQELKKFRKYGMTRKESPDVVKRMERKALDKVIAEKLLIQESQQVKIDDIEKKVDERVEKTKIKYKTEENFKKYLESKKTHGECLARKFKKEHICR